MIESSTSAASTERLIVETRDFMRASRIHAVSPAGLRASMSQANEDFPEDIGTQSLIWSGRTLIWVELISLTGAAEALHSIGGHDGAGEGACCGEKGRAGHAHQVQAARGCVSSREDAGASSGAYALSNCIHPTPDVSQHQRQQR